MSECSGDHDWRINPFVVLPSNPPQRRVVCAECGKEDTMPEGAASALSSDDPTDWPKLE